MQAEPHCLAAGPGRGTPPGEFRPITIIWILEQPVLPHHLFHAMWQTRKQSIPRPGVHWKRYGN
jgi:hypothetical protein